MPPTLPGRSGDAPSTKVLLIEDDATLSKALEYLLEKEGYTVHSAGDGVQGVALAGKTRPDVVLLDIMLPLMDGIEVCRLLRARSTTTPIIFMTAKGEEVDRVLGLELGADDYITKPFSTRELLARIRAVLRRARAQSGVLQPMESGDLLIDFQARLARRGGAPLPLSPREFALLSVFAANKDRALTREQILEALDGPGHVGDVRTVDVHVRWLRKKIEQEPGNPSRIVTVRGIGYRFDG